jgi:hypothetical protein
LGEENATKFENGTDEIVVLVTDEDHGLVKMLLETENEENGFVHER